MQEAHPHAVMAAETSEAARRRASSGPCTICCSRTRRTSRTRIYTDTRPIWPRHGAVHRRDGRSHLSAEVREHIEGGRRSHIRATPTFFVDGVVQDISFGMKHCTTWWQPPWDAAARNRGDGTSAAIGVSPGSRLAPVAAATAIRAAAPHHRRPSPSRDRSCRSRSRPCRCCRSRRRRRRQAVSRRRRRGRHRGSDGPALHRNHARADGQSGGESACNARADAAAAHGAGAVTGP